MSPHNLGRPQRVDSIVRTLTTALLALSLVGAVILLALTAGPSEQLSDLGLVLIGWAGVVVGFYFGGHVAANTAAVEEARQVKATETAGAAALRSEDSAQRSEAAAPGGPRVP